MHILVIGGGPGGYVAAIRAAQLGAQVTLVEKQYLGGTCLNVGCVPTKALLHGGSLYAELREAAEYGIHAEAAVDFSQMQKKKAAVVQQLVRGVTGLLKANKVTVKMGTAAFVGPRTVSVASEDGKAEEITADKIIIAVGSVPSIPPVPGLDSTLCIDSTGALALEEIPERLVVIGGGVIGMEMADLYTTLGAKVTVLEMLPEILPPLDRDVSAQARAAFQGKGMDIHVSTQVKSVTEENGQAVVTVRKDGQERQFTCDKVLVATGRHSAAGSLMLEKAGIEQERGNIKVNEYLETNVAGVYAIGDCIPGIMLAHVASVQGELAAENAMGHAVKYSEKNIPSCVYTSPELSGVGLTEQECEKRGIPYKVGKFPLAANGRTLILNGGDGFVKAIIGAQYGELLGLHMIGPYASELLTEGTLALDLEATADEIIASIHAHPTVSEAIREAVMSAEHRAIHCRN